MAKSVWIAIDQPRMMIDAEQVAHGGDLFLRQEKHRIAFRVTSTKGYQFSCVICPVKCQTLGEGQVGSTNLEEGLSYNDTSIIVYPKGKLAALGLIFRRLELCMLPVFTVREVFKICRVFGPDMISPIIGGRRLATLGRWGCYIRLEETGHLERLKIMSVMKEVCATEPVVINIYGGMISPDFLK
jgi:hypothetical protein